jgi:hypothetical protein
MEEYEQYLIAFFQDRIQDYSPTWAVQLLANSSQDYRAIVKAVDETVAIWYTPVEWFSDDVLPVAYQAVPKEWVAFHDTEVFIAPIYDLRPGIGYLETVFGRNLSGSRIANLENPGGFVTKCAGTNSEIPDVERTLATWESPKQLQEQFSWRPYEISSTIEPAKAKFTDFLGHFTMEEILAITLGLASADSWCLKPRAAGTAGIVEKDPLTVPT